MKSILNSIYTFKFKEKWLLNATSVTTVLLCCQVSWFLFSAGIPDPEVTILRGFPGPRKSVRSQCFANSTCTCTTYNL